MDNGFNPIAGHRLDQASMEARSTDSSGQSPNRDFEELFHRVASERGMSSREKREGLVRLGTITEETPTVSHMLMQYSGDSEQCWDIVHDPVNRDKPFRDMSRGETVWLDPGSKEIVFGENPGAEPNAAHGSPSPAPDTVSDLFHDEQSRTSGMPTLSTGNLNQAVTSYSGTPYSRLDCYELVVQGLKDMGVDYSGRKGLQHQLMQRARQEERAPNAYLTGEGLIRSLGSRVFQQDVSGISHPEGTARELMRSLGNRLEPGMILSLSTPSGGHTGVISRKDGQWTFINSGRIQHAVDGENIRHGVAEEDLHSELAGWLERAGEKGQSLSISVGRLSPDKLSRFTDPQEGLSTTA
ncbi:MAG: hypothetical protein K9K39_08720 [Desulfohalobiaceae bacterium]|nr:hypothetical protein [Desulfohalobiaceae bacterium]